ncbi:MAG: polysaccharide pyruvyl transferase [Hydrogenophilales bacterium 17-61-9]|nr:MAG: polysaccharide pyruvyl transferase [Hydrogenophilales bacterium 17-61-9]
MTKARPSITIGLLWHSFSSDNLGVGALSESQVAICEAAALRAGADLRFIVFGTTGGRDYTPAGKNIRQGSHISLKQLVTGRSPFLRELEECDLVLDIGEGDSFADIYSKRRFRMQIATKFAVLAKRRPLILSPQTIGPFDRWSSRWVAKLIMGRCAHVFARDGLSAEYLRTVSLGDNMSEAIDVAFRLPYTKPTNERSEKCRIGLNVSGLLFSGGYEGGNQFGLTVDYPRLIRDLLTEWCGDKRNEVWLIPHVLSDLMPRDDDRVAIARLAAEFPVAHKAPDFMSPSEAKSFIASMDFVTGARMHACIAAFSSGVPVVPFSYSRKFNGLFNSLGYGWLADGKCMGNEEAKNMIVEGLQRRQELAEIIGKCQNIAEERLSRYEDSLYLTMKHIDSPSQAASGEVA